MLRRLIHDGQNQKAAKRAFAKGVADGMSAVALLWRIRPRPRRYASTGIGGDWHLVGGDVQAAMRSARHAER